MNERLRQVHERVWQFKLLDTAEQDTNEYFDNRAKEMAAALNYRLVATSQIKVEPTGTFRIVSGRALVEGACIVRRGGRLPKKR